MKYKLAFVNEVKNYRHDFYYIDELKDVFMRHNMMEHWDTKIVPVMFNRWTPGEIFKALENE